MTVNNEVFATQSRNDLEALRAPCCDLQRSPRRIDSLASKGVRTSIHVQGNAGIWSPQCRETVAPTIDKPLKTLTRIPFTNRRLSFRHAP